jgi:hypothetical protein
VVGQKAISPENSGLSTQKKRAVIADGPFQGRTLKKRRLLAKEVGWGNPGKRAAALKNQLNLLHSTRGRLTRSKRLQKLQKKKQGSDQLQKVLRAAKS